MEDTRQPVRGCFGLCGLWEFLLFWTAVMLAWDGLDLYRAAWAYTGVVHLPFWGNATLDFVGDNQALTLYDIVVTSCDLIFILLSFLCGALPPRAPPSRPLPPAVSASPSDRAGRAASAQCSPRTPIACSARSAASRWPSSWSLGTWSGSWWSSSSRRWTRWPSAHQHIARPALPHPTRWGARPAHSPARPPAQRRPDHPRHRLRPQKINGDGQLVLWLIVFLPYTIVLAFRCYGLAKLVAYRLLLKDGREQWRRQRKANEASLLISA